jgi:NADPH-dependent curcumin reductase CurA
MSRPEALPGSDNFALKDYALPQLGENMVHVRNRWLSVDPYMRGRMNEAKSYIRHSRSTRRWKAELWAR